MSKRPDHAPVDRPEPARAVGHDQAGQPVDQAAEEPRAAQADQRLLVATGLEEPRANHQVQLAPFQFLNQPFDFAGPVLPVTINLHGDVIPVQGGITVSGLHRPANPQIERQGDHCCPRGDLPDSIVSGTIIDYDDVESWQGALQLLYDPAHGRPFVECRYNHQAFQR